MTTQANQGRNRMVMFCVFQDNTCDVPSVGQEILCCTLFVSHLQQAKPNFSLQLKPPYDPFSHLLIRGVYKVILEQGWMRLFCFIQVLLITTLVKLFQPGMSQEGVKSLTPKMLLKYKYRATKKRVVSGQSKQYYSHPRQLLWSPCATLYG